VEDLLRRGFVVSAEAALEQRAAARKDDGEARVALAAIAVSRHDVDRALAILESAKHLLPRPRGLDYVRGLALLRGGRAEAAADAFAEALEEEPDDWAASFQLALHFRRRGRRLQEEVALEHALLRLEEEPIPVPDHGPAAILLDSVHRDPAAALREGRLRRTEIATRAAGRSP
ncbi:MAG TPA: hypothetical protein VND21_11605, partial [Planctomycetota bacterium]|nr:hypothetical protein [Planctomycetota bacterium]